MVTVLIHHQMKQNPPLHPRMLCEDTPNKFNQVGFVIEIYVRIMAGLSSTQTGHRPIGPKYCRVHRARFNVYKTVEELHGHCSDNKSFLRAGKYGLSFLYRFSGPGSRVLERPLAIIRSQE